jgi:hypothetical protein
VRLRRLRVPRVLWVRPLRPLRRGMVPLQQVVRLLRMQLLRL